MGKNHKIIDLYSILISSLSSDNEYRSTFKTSQEILQKVMNVPMSTVKSILKANGYDDIDDETSFCIDEKGLGIFADAYIRKMKKYFKRSILELDALPDEERRDFFNFIKLFQKEDFKESEDNDYGIDFDHLKEVFIESVKDETYNTEMEIYSREEEQKILAILYGSERTCISFASNLYLEYCKPSENTHRPPAPQQLNFFGHSFTIFPTPDSHRAFQEFNWEEISRRVMCPGIQITDSPGITPESGLDELIANLTRLEEEKELLESISHSNNYIGKPPKPKPVWWGINLISRFVTFARYYIYSLRGDDDYHSADFNSERNISLGLKNSTGLRLCS